jgi:signal transduction histidine kinase
MARPHLILFIFAFFICGNLFCQNEKGFSVREFNTENGLPSNGIKGLQWDEQMGFLWIATEAGLVRFNGLNFKTYTNKNTPFIQSERLLFLAKNNHGDIFSADTYSNLIEVQSNNPTPFAPIPDEDKKRNLLFSIIVSKDFFRQATKRQAVNEIPITYSKVLPIGDTSCYIQNAGSLYYFSSSTGFPQKVDLKAIPSIKTIFKIGDRAFIYTNTNEVFSLHELLSKQTAPKNLLSRSGIDVSDKENNIYWQNGMQNPILINKNSAWKLLLKNNEVIPELICTSVPLNSFIEFVQYSDKLQMLFIGTNSKGILVVAKNQLNALSTKVTDKSIKNAYYSQVELSNGNILTNQGNVLGSNANNQLPITGSFNFYTYLDKDSILWFSQADPLLNTNCLHSYNYKTKQSIAYPKIWNNAGAAFVKCNNKLFIAHTSGIGFLDGDSVQYLYRSASNITPYDMLQLKQDVLALATCNTLVLINTTTSKLDTVFTTTDNCIRTLWKYEDYLFFGTYGKGYYVYKDGIIKAMPLDVNNYLAYTHCFMQDDEGYVWMSSNRGLFKTKLSDIVDAYEKNTAQIYYHYFGKDDGMNTSEMNGGCTPCAIELRNKTLSFPTMDGLLQVNPKTISPILPSGDIFIDEIVVDGKPLADNNSKGLSFPYTIKEIAINLSFSGWCNKENIYLEYQLDNDSNWKKVNIDNGASIKFSNPSSGYHVLNIRKLNGFGITNFSYKEIRFFIATPWYKKWWFTLILITAVMAFFLLIYKLRTRRFRIKQLRLQKQIAEKTKELKKKNEILEKNDSIKTRLISIISHDIVTPLKFLSVAGKNLQEKRKQMPDELQQETIEEITNTATELQLLSTNILNWIKYQTEHRRLVKENFNVAEMVNQVFGVLKSLAKKKQIKLVNNVADDLVVTQFFEPLKIAVYNVVSNAINFSEGGSIIVSCNALPESITITIADEGVGMTAEQIHNIMAEEYIISSANIDHRKGNGLGYLIIKDLLKMMGSSLQISSKKNEGTTVSFTVPVKR